MFGTMFQSKMQNLRKANASANLHRIWISDETAATRDLFTQGCLVDDAQTRLISGKINASGFCQSAMQHSPRAKLLLCIAVTFERTFAQPPAVSVTANRLICGVKSLDEAAIVTKIANVAPQGCEIILEIADPSRGLNGLHIGWIALGAKPNHRFGGLQ
jgi:hypothetical protein